MRVKGSLVEKIKTAELRWFGYMKMMTDKRLSKKIYKWMSKEWRKWEDRNKLGHRL